MGLRQKSAIYEAYTKLVPVLIPKGNAIGLMMKWVPGWKQKIASPTATVHSGRPIIKHPKSLLLEYALKNCIAPPKTIFSEFTDDARNMRIWTAKVTFCGKIIESQGAKKKDAECNCFRELVKYVINGSIINNNNSYNILCNIKSKLFIIKSNIIFYMKSI